MSLKGLLYAPAIWYTKRQVLARLRAQDIKGALADCDRMLRWDRDNFSVYMLRGSIYGQFRKYEPAAADFRRAAALKPRNADAHALLGVTLQQQGALDAALPELEAALTLGASRPETAYASRAHVRRQKEGDFQGALADCERAIEANPRFGSGYFEKGMTLGAMGDHQGAITAYDKVLSLNPRHSVAYYNRGNERREMGDLNGALADYDRALKITPNAAKALDNRAAVYTRLENYDAALADLNKAIEIEPDDAIALTNRGKVYSDTRRLAEALADFQSAAALDPDNATIQSNLGARFLEQQQDEQALVYLNRALELDPGFVMAYNNRGSLYSVRGDFEAALADFNRTLELDPTLATAYVNRAALYFRMGDYTPAEADIATAQTFRMRPYILHAALMHEAIINRALGKTAEARQTWQKLIQAAPELANTETLFEQYPRMTAETKAAIRELWAEQNDTP